MQVTPRSSNTPRASHPAQDGKVIQYEDVDLKLGEGYQTPAAAKSVQKDAVDVDGERIQLGKKYHTQGWSSVQLISGT